ncbi:protocadherin-8-like [Antennarius striatus]|uniref:protocadherin-8-like n=1 Tax=Antennarius striatus TaxID=241820 RepID=UPI0035B2A71D
MMTGTGRLWVACVYLAMAAGARGKTVKYQTCEEDAPGTVIGNLAKDVSPSPPAGGSRSSFRMMKQFNSSFVRLREGDGQLTVGERIDRERLCRRAARCLLAFDVIRFSREGGGEFQLLHVEVEVRDINDHPPEFPRKEWSLELSENTAVGARVPLDSAVDDDVGANYIQTYRLSADPHFTVDVLSRADGVKYAELVLMKELDRETQGAHTLELVAADGGTPSRSGTTRVHVKVRDYNDNSPVFERNSVSVDVREDAPVGALLLQLRAEDPDEGPNGEVVFGFGEQVPEEVRRLFRVDRKSGRLTLGGPLDFELKTTYELHVTATDLGPSPAPSTCKVVVQVRDVNDNPPEVSITPMTSITAGVAYVTEAAARESFVALVSTADRDAGANGQVRCSLHGHAHFRLQQAYEDSFMIVSTGPLDREDIPEYNLTVVAEDLGAPPLRTVTRYTIRLTDVNDNPPVFGQPLYEVSVPENNAPGALIATVGARDADTGANGEVSYRLADTPPPSGPPVSTFVSLDPATGALYALRSFNYEVTKHLELRVTATDGGAPPLSGSAAVRLRIVDRNDNVPVVTRPALVNGSADVPLPRDAPSGYVVTRVEARDADEGVNAQLTFGLAPGGPSLFSVDTDTGELRLNRALSGDVHEPLRVTVTVTDNGTPALSSSAVLRVLIVAGPPPGHRAAARPPGSAGGEARAPPGGAWDLSVVIIVVLAGSCALLLLAIVLIATSCNRRARDKTGDDGDEYGEKERAPERGRAHLVDNPLLPLHGGVVGFEDAAHPPPGGGGDMCSASEDGSVHEPEKPRGNKHEGYSVLPGYGPRGVRPVTVWKGNAYATITARPPAFSGKDSGKGDSDFNDSDSDVSGDTGPKREGGAPVGGGQNALWACTSECKVLGHSDRCWSPTGGRAHATPSPAPTLSSFGVPPRTASLPRDPHRRDNYYQAHLPKTVGLQSVYEKVLLGGLDYVLVTPPSDATLPVYTPTPTHRPSGDA